MRHRESTLVKIREKRTKQEQMRFEKIEIDKNRLEKAMSQHGLHGARKMLGLTEGSVRYWASIYNIPITLHKRPSYTCCDFCGKKYSDDQRAKGIRCSTCISKIRRLSSKIRAIEYAGGRCLHCGFQADGSNYAAFEFHHHDSNKETEVGNLLNRKWEVIREEIDKCIVLCSNCHRVEHSDYDNKELLKLAKSAFRRFKSCPSLQS